MKGAKRTAVHIVMFNEGEVYAIVHHKLGKKTTNGTLNMMPEMKKKIFSLRHWFMNWNYTMFVFQKTPTISGK